MTTTQGSGPIANVEGLDRLVRTMRKCGSDLDDLKDASRRAGDIVVRAAQARAPRRTGRLAGSIRAARQARRVRVSAGRSSVPYAGPIHWGWPARHIRAQPFISEAATETETQWVEAYRRDVAHAVDQVKGA